MKTTATLTATAVLSTHTHTHTQDVIQLSNYSGSRLGQTGPHCRETTPTLANLLIDMSTCTVSNKPRRRRKRNWNCWKIQLLTNSAILHRLPLKLCKVIACCVVPIMESAQLFQSDHTAQYWCHGGHGSHFTATSSVNFFPPSFLCPFMVFLSCGRAKDN